MHLLYSIIKKSTIGFSSKVNDFRTTEERADDDALDVDYGTPCSTTIFGCCYLTPSSFEQRYSSATAAAVKLDYRTNSSENE